MKLNIVNLVKNYFKKRKLKKEFERKLKELRERDPFVYKNH